MYIDCVPKPGLMGLDVGQREVSKGTLCILSDLVFGRGLPKSRSYPGKQDSVLPSWYLDGQPVYLVSLYGSSGPCSILHIFPNPILPAAFRASFPSCRDTTGARLVFQNILVLSFSMVIDLGFLLVAHNRYLSCAGFNIKSLDSGGTNT